MNILYSCSFPISGDEGKNRATKQKLIALSKQSRQLDVFYPNAATTSIGKTVSIISSELRLLWNLIRGWNHYNFYIGRGISGWLGVPVAKLLRVSVVREIHGDPLDESGLISENKTKVCLLRVTSYLEKALMRMGDIRIFNHPYLLNDWKKEYGNNGKDFYVYNGGGLSAKCDIDKEKARHYLGLDNEKHILGFVGTASLWHGIDYLVALQERFDKHGDPVQIVCGGGKISRDIDPCNRIRNISPLDEKKCSILIRASDACLLPVKWNRKSPGSPLKLYDYIINERPVVSQKNVAGYSDEVHFYDVGIVVDFIDSAGARLIILEYLESSSIAKHKENCLSAKPYITWDERIKEWLEQLKRNSSYPRKDGE